MATNLKIRSLLFTAFGILSFIATLGSSAPLSSAQASPTTNDIAVTLSESRTTLPSGQQVQFTARMTNRGPDNAPFVDVYFGLPAQLKTLSITCDQGTTPDGPACEYVSLPVGATVVSRLVASIDPAAPRRARLLKITASARFENPGILDPNLSNNTASVRLWLFKKPVAP